MAVNVTVVPVVDWPPTLPLVKTFELSPLLLVLSDVVVAVAASVVKVIVHEPSDAGWSIDSGHLGGDIQRPGPVQVTAGSGKAESRAEVVGAASRPLQGCAGTVADSRRIVGRRASRAWRVEGVLSGIRSSRWAGMCPRARWGRC